MSISPTLFNNFLENIISDALKEHDENVSTGGRNITTCGLPMTSYTTISCRSYLLSQISFHFDQVSSYFQWLPASFYEHPLQSIAKRKRRKGREK